MKHTLLYIYIIAAAVMTGGMTVSCDEVDESERLIYVKPADVKRHVLIEDFTGQRCVNCPMAAEEIEKLQTQYGEENVIAVSIHGGAFGVFTSTDKIMALATEEARQYYDHWKVESQPSGIVNRRGGVALYTAWATAVYNELQRPSAINIDLACHYDTMSRQLTANISILSGKAFSGKLQLWIVEDNITAFQLMPDGKPNTAYRHRHVFRKSMNSTWGTDITLGETPVEQTFTVALDDDRERLWNIDNLSVIAFVCSDEGVEQCVISRVNK